MLDQLIKNQKIGIDINKLKPGTEIVITTYYNVYRITKLKGDREIMIKGGKYFKVSKKVHLNGSTWGSSMIKIGWIGKGMHMEILNDRKKVLTSPVESAKIIGNNWEYEIEW